MQSTNIFSQKTDRIIYWISTIWLSLGMLSTGIVQLIQVKAEVDYIIMLGYPAYFLILIGVWKVLGVMAILLPKFPLLKEWAYAGFFFTSTGAIVSQVVSLGWIWPEVLPLLLFFLLILVSWFFRPADRRLSR
jgi:hypothetical protein